MVWSPGRKHFNSANYLVLGLDAERRRAAAADEATPQAESSGPAGGGNWASDFSHLPLAPANH
eukprot:3824732-Pyramimonas_sp.AAC.1